MASTSRAKAPLAQYVYLAIALIASVFFGISLGDGFGLVSLAMLLLIASQVGLFIWAASAPSTKHVTFGVAEYAIHKDGSLHGTWTIRPYKGRLGTEIATNGTPGEVAGSYDVNIFDPDGNTMYSGQLTIAATEHKHAFEMTWTSPGKPTYTGLGIMAGPGRLAANYRTVVK